jgi:glyoxylase-like metal-dependent hydrolase (beta-lactamase superfamily II)
MKIPLEDNFADIVGKAAKGRGWDDSRLTQAAGLSSQQFTDLKNGRGDDAAVKRLAETLELNPNALLDSFHQRWRPEEGLLPDGVLAFNLDIVSMAVNSYLVWDPASLAAALFDAGIDVRLLQNAMSTRNLKLTGIYLTHTHGDHTIEAVRLARHFQAPLFCPVAERFGQATPVSEGDRFSIGALGVRALLTNGHSPGGITYVIEGLAKPVAVVGDAIFAGSMGGAANEFALAWANNRQKILSLPEQTVLLPGHGPVSTVDLELQHNPFFAA